MRESVQPVIATLPKVREKSAAPKTSPCAFVLHSIRRSPEFMEVADAAISSEMLLRRMFNLCVVCLEKV